MKVSALQETNIELFLLTKWLHGAESFKKLIVSQWLKKFPSFLWNQKVYYCVDKSLPSKPKLTQMNPVHILTPCHFNIILLSTPVYQVVSLLEIFWINLVCILISPYMLHDLPISSFILSLT
jgi:hypothetical protein